MISNFSVRWIICGKSIANVIAFMITLEIIEFLTRPTLTFDRDGSNALGAKSSHNNFKSNVIFFIQRTFDNLTHSIIHVFNS